MDDIGSVRSAVKLISMWLRLTQLVVDDHAHCCTCALPCLVVENLNGKIQGYKESLIALGVKETKEEKDLAHV